MKQAFVVAVSGLVLTSCGLAPRAAVVTVTARPTPTVTRTITAPATSATTRSAAVQAAPERTVCGFVAGYQVSVEGPTSCPFAADIAWRYWDFGQPTSFEAYSEVTGRWYLVRCRGYPVRCTGGNGAVVILR